MLLSVSPFNKGKKSTVHSSSWNANTIEIMPLLKEGLIWEWRLCLLIKSSSKLTWVLWSRFVLLCHNYLWLRSQGKVHKKPCYVFVFPLLTFTLSTAVNVLFLSCCCHSYEGLRGHQRLSISVLFIRIKKPPDLECSWILSSVRFHIYL